MQTQGHVFKYGDNVDTDVIIPARYLNTSDAKELAKHCMEDIDASYVSKVQPGDIMVAGWNFGCGSSREHAPIALLNMGAAAVLADSFARIFYRNAINLGLPVITCAGISKKVQPGYHVELNIEAGTVTVQETGEILNCDKLGGQAQLILSSGGIKPMMRARFGKA